MRKLIKCPLFSLIVLLIFSGKLTAQQYNFRNFTVRDGVAQSQVYSMIQDHRGYLWLGTRGGGLCRFDGSKFESYTEKNGLINSYIRKIRQDKKNRLWITTDNGCSVYDGRKFRNYYPLGKTKPLIVYDLAFGQNNQVWLATASGLILFENGQFTNLSQKAGVPETTINSLLIDRKNRLWIATGEGLYRMSLSSGKRQAKHLGKESKYMYNAVNVVKEDTDGTVWIGTYGDGAYCYKNGHYFRIDFHHELYTRTVLDIWCDQKTVWFGTLNHGVVSYDKSTRRFGKLTEKEGLSNNHVRSILQDNAGTMWFGTSGAGISNYVGKLFTVYDESTGLSGSFIYSVFRDSRKRLWIGTSRRGITLMTTSGFQRFDASNGFADVKVKAIAEDANGWLYFGTDGEGVYLYDGNSFKQLNRLGMQYVRGMQRDDLGKIWVATAGSGMAFIQPDKSFDPHVEVYLMGRGLLSNRLTCLHIDKRNRIWYGTENNGIGFIENGKASRAFIRSKEGLVSDAVRSITEDKSGCLWIGTAGSGIARINLYSGSPKPVNYSYANGLTSSNIYLLSVDKRNNLITGTEKGLDYVKLNRRRHPVSVRHYGKGEGFTGIETCQNAVFKDTDGTIWFGTINGLAHYNPANARRNTHEPVTGITDVRLFYESLAKTPYADAIGEWNEVQELQLPYDQNHLTFDFFAINLNNPEGVRYRWKLDGFEENWSPATSEHSIVYSNIPPGNYTFLVKASNEDGTWNREPQKVQISISAPFWQQTWFRLLMVIGMAGVIALLFRWRLDRVRKKSQELQQRLQLEKEVVELEQKALRLQMNPHFIFNALNSIQSQIGNGNEQEARYYLAKFSRLMRQILDNSRSTLITLEQEVETLENYLLIEQYCNGNRFDYTISVDESLEPDFVKLPPMLLQPFVENAIKHGFRFPPEENRRGKITIQFSDRDPYLECLVTDNGIGRERAEELNSQSKETYHVSTALTVTRERLELYQSEGPASSLEITDLKDETGQSAGTRVVIRIPF